MLATQEFNVLKFTFTKEGIQRLTKLLKCNKFQFSSSLEVAFSLPELINEFSTEPITDKFDLALELLRCMEKIRRIADGERNLWEYTGHWISYDDVPRSINHSDYKKENQPEYWVITALWTSGNLNHRA